MGKAGQNWRWSANPAAKPPLHRSSSKALTIAIIRFGLASHCGCSAVAMENSFLFETI
jgi:hypothetical protein